MPHSWEEIDAAFGEAADLEGAARETFLGVLSAELRHDVETMLAAGAGSTQRMEGLVAGAAVSLSAEDAAPASVGPWRIVKLIAEGGMGAVYLSEREGEGFKQSAALKLLRRGFDTRFFVSRFRQERRILAALDHPNIARLLDGGAATDGRPYLALEFIDGQTITEYAAGLALARRIELFLDVCKAVEHAHQHMVIHRDLKPSNILVNGQGQTKLLDFGIAKILDPEATGGSLALTGTDVKLMTPEYAAPEQVRGEAITTATDVYCLGLVLYEVLSGTKPIALPVNAPLEAARLVCEQEPAKTALAPDVDAILRKCLRKEPQSRYASVASLREDLERVLRGEPVSAYTGAWSYRTGKWLRRYKWGVAAAALVLATLTGGILATQRQARIAERRYSEVRRIARGVIFDVYDQVETLPGATKARETIVNMALGYLEALRADAGDDPGLAMELAEAYLKVGDVLGNAKIANLGRGVEATASFEKALALYRGIAAKAPAAAGGNHGQAQAHLRLAIMAHAKNDAETIVYHATEGERLELSEPGVETKRDWRLLVQLGHEHVAAARERHDGPAMRAALNRADRYARQWDRLQSNKESRYFLGAIPFEIAESSAFEGEPSRAAIELENALAKVAASLGAGFDHAWLHNDVIGWHSIAGEMRFGFLIPSTYDVPAALLTEKKWERAVQRYSVTDQNDYRNKLMRLMVLNSFLPALAEANPKAGLARYQEIFAEVERYTAEGRGAYFDDSDRVQLANGGVRALRLLGRNSEAIAIARGQIEMIKAGQTAKSAKLAHLENLLRLELHRMGKEDRRSVEIAKSHHAVMPASLLLHADLVQMLTLSGKKVEAEEVLNQMRSCEFQRRLKKLLEIGKFFYDP